MSVSSPHAKVHDVLTSIDAKGYRNLKVYPAFERDLDEQVRRLGLDRVVAETQALRTWLEAKFAAGQLKRDARHYPQVRFMRWLRKCTPGDNGNKPATPTGVEPCNHGSWTVLKSGDLKCGHCGFVERKKTLA